MKENQRRCVKCGISPSEDPNITLHRFPKVGKRNNLRCKLWAKYCYPNMPWASTEFHAKIYSEHRMICSRHFRSMWFSNGPKKQLYKCAVPGDEVTTAINDTEEEAVAGPSNMNQPLTENINVANVMITTTVIPQHITIVPSAYEPLPTPILETELNVQTEIANKALAPTPEKLKYCLNHLQKISRLQKTIKRLRNESFLNVLSNNESVCKIVKTKLSPAFALMLQGQIQNFNKKGQGRRWNEDCKIVALRLYKRSPTAYRLLRRLMCLPAPGTLKHLLNKFHMHVGINNKIFSVLKKNVKYLAPGDKQFILMFDEMSIKKNLYYNEKDDLIEGFQDHDKQGRSPQVAAYALVFMVAGIRKKVKQPVAYYFSGGSVTADRLAVLLKEVLGHCFDAGINIAASVCDMDGVNKRALTILGATKEQPYITFSDHEVVTLFDTPHLLKCFRNLFLKYNIKCPINITTSGGIGEGIAKWSHIKNFYEIDNKNLNFVFAPSLRKDHLEPNTKQKMKVKLAAQVLSHSVAAGMYAKISQGELSTEAIVTANLVSDMDKLFDSVNSYTSDLRRGKPLATNLKSTTPHIQFFQKMKAFFDKIVFLDCKRSPPSQTGWIWTLTGLERVWWNLSKQHGTMKSLATRRLQQDPIENLFGCIRANCGSNINPTAGQFIAGMKTAVLSNLSSTANGNCEKDENEVIIDNIKSLLSASSAICTNGESPSELLTDFEQSLSHSFDLSMSEENGEVQACAYVCGFFIKRNTTECFMCKNIFVTDAREEFHLFTQFKEYNEIKESLKYASKNFIVCVESCATLTNGFLKERAHERNLKAKAKEILKSSVNFDFLKECSCHREINTDTIINNVWKVVIKRFCILRNRKFAEEHSASALKRKMNIVQHR